jgi:hypothetical protein
MTPSFTTSWDLHVRGFTGSQHLPTKTMLNDAKKEKVQKDRRNIIISYCSSLLRLHIGTQARAPR